MKRLKGFTLVELLVVIAIIAILLAILIPALASVKEKGKRIQCGYNLSGLSKSIGFYCDDYDGKFPYLRYADSSNMALSEDQRATESHPYAVYIAGWTWLNTSTLIPMKLACLFSTGIVTNSKLFYCPACTTDDYKWETYSTPAPWPHCVATSTGNSWTRTGYGFRPLGKVDKTTGILPVAFKLVDINYNKPWLTDLIWNIDSLNHVAGNANVAKGIYAAFPDGHVNFCTNPAMFSPTIWQGDLQPTSKNYSDLLNLMEP
jgi:prepilin-type N-terminal cleavage/methylation domain-containing protein